jgi:AraC-like DNA-binding protein
MNSPPATANFDQEVIHAIERQMLPCWEHYGLARLVTNADTLAAFVQRPMPEQVNAWVKKRKSRRTQAHNSFPIIKSWPEDDQHSVRFPALVFVRQGRADFRVADYVISCPQDHFVLLRPGVPRPAGLTPFLEEPRQGKHCELWWFKSMGVTNHVALSVMSSTGDRQVSSGHYYIVNESRTVHQFHSFVDEILNQPSDSGHIATLLLQTFLLMFAREIRAERFYNRGVDNLPRSVSGAASTIEMACQYIDKNLNHALTIDRVAQAVFMARTNFVRKFQQETGMTFRDYLTQKRLQEAEYWLLQEDCPIEMVGKFVGLKPSRFHQLFREKHGLTPLEYRRAVKND